MEKLDYVHTRLSIPIVIDLSRGTYVAQTLKKIVDCKSYTAPENKRLFDIIAIDDVARAYLMIGKDGKNKADYFIGTSRPAKLVDYFEFMANQVKGVEEDVRFTRYASDENLFSTEAIYRDTGFFSHMQFEDMVQKFKSL